MKNQRILSIDIFRGFTIFMMVFVNDLAGVANIPGWMKHVAADVNGMTFVDVVFPAFLFIVGMSIPFAVEKRLEKGSLLAFWQHVLLRTFGLLVLGVYMVNSAEMNTEANLIPKSIWAVSLYVAAILIWNRYPKTEDRTRKNLFTGLRILGIITLVILYFLYRKGPEDALTGMTSSWWGILGLIGWAYLISVLMYMLAAKKLIPLIIIFAALLSFLLILRADPPLLSEGLNWFRGQSGHISHSLLTVAGIICSLFLRQGGVVHAPKVKIRNMLLMAVILFLIGYLVLPFGGVSKIGATPSWSLFCAGICCVLFPLLYWLVDVKGFKDWANFLKPAGTNPLLTYILPPIVYAIFGFSFLPDFLNSGFPGFLRAIVFSLLILTWAAWFTRKGIRMQL